jgi:hypothetical protein
MGGFLVAKLFCVYLLAHKDKSTVPGSNTKAGFTSDEDLYDPLWIDTSQPNIKENVITHY